MSSASLTLVSILAMMAIHPMPNQPPPQKGEADWVEHVRPAIVEMGIEITNLDQSNPPAHPIPVQMPNCFNGHPICIAGTGFFVNDKGDVVTASHVAIGIQGVITKLEASGIHAAAIMGVSMPNVETTHLTMASSAVLFPMTLAAMDTEHDVAVFHATVNPFSDMVSTFTGPGATGLPQTEVSFLRLDVTRPRDAEEIFACGFPFGDPGLVTTTGEIASAWKSDRLVTSKDGFPVDLYWVDLRINPGNSGGPVLRASNQAVLGMAVETEGSIGIVVPAKYITAFLKTHNIQWYSADVQNSKSGN